MTLDNPLSGVAANRPLALRARYVFPVAAPPLADGLLTIAGERIIAVGQNLSGVPPIDLGNVAILPGLVNAHTHLEFSDLSAPLGRPGVPLPEWIRDVLGVRARQQDAEAVIRRGLEQSLAAGTTALGEIVTAGWSNGDRGLESRSEVHVTLFQELIGLSSERVQTAVGVAEKHLDSWEQAPWCAPGLSPLFGDVE